MHGLCLRATSRIGMFAKRALLPAMEDDDSSGRRRKDRARKLEEHDVLGMYSQLARATDAIFFIMTRVVMSLGKCHRGPMQAGLRFQNRAVLLDFWFCLAIIAVSVGNAVRTMTALMAGAMATGDADMR